LSGLFGQNAPFFILGHRSRPFLGASRMYSDVGGRTVRHQTKGRDPNAKFQTGFVSTLILVNLLPASTRYAGTRGSSVRKTIVSGSVFPS
jgi:hypothetical protein